ncbi:hypothetical protein MBLNU230_g5602t1 [Neophaeotheca triangularis]
MATLHILPRANPNGNCTLSTCDPVESVFGYRPHLGETVFFLILFTLSGLLHLYQGLRTKTWFFSTAMVIGSIAETLGYAAKLLLWQDPFSHTGFIMNVVLLTFAPAFYSAGIYYTLKHICLTFGSRFSRLQPWLYTWVFVGLDMVAIILQAAGGAVASVTETMAVVDQGTNVMIAGLVSQVVTLFAFGVLAADYGCAVYRNRRSLNPSTVELRRSGVFRAFLVALTVAYTGVLIRCAYRVAELSGGWGPQNTIMRNPWLFLGLDSVPVALATVVLNLAHPGWCFPKERQDVAEKEERLARQDGGASDVESAAKA